jgi:transposase InsO family protein
MSAPDRRKLVDCSHGPLSIRQQCRGFFYLVAIMDWLSRAVLAWRLSNTMDSAFRRRGA